MNADKNSAAKETSKDTSRRELSEEDKKRIEEMYREKVTVNSTFPLSEIFYEDPRTASPKKPESGK